MATGRRDTPAVKPVLDAHTQRVIEEALARYGQEPGNVLPVLQQVQAALGYVPAGAILALANGLNRSRAELQGVLDFYPHFRHQPPARATLAVCQAEACVARGAHALTQQLEERFGCALHTPATAAEVASSSACHDRPGKNPSSANAGAVAIEPVYCLGLCAQGPVASLNEHAIAHATADKITGALQEMLQQTPGSADAATSQATATATALQQEQVPPGCAEQPVSQRIYVPRDTSALAAGADAVAQAIARQANERGLTIQIIRNGSRGLLWLEPLVEVETPHGRIAYGPVQEGDIRGLFDAGWLHGGDHPLCHGLTHAIPYLARQDRLTFARIGLADPLCLDNYQKLGGFAGLEKALGMSPAALVAAVTESGLRGRGGAAFPAGIKWQTVLNAAARQKYVLCNADEGDSGTFADRLLMEGDPYSLIEGMIIAGLATGATQGYVYVRAEYPNAIQLLEHAIARAQAAGWLGDNLRGTERCFRLTVRAGAGAYICGEETALLESLEGKRGQVRSKPPLPAIKGLFGQPTLVHNVLTLASLPFILAHGAQAFQALGTGRSRGTLAVQLAGNLRHGGLVEKAFGLTLRELLYDFGGGSASGRPLKAVQVGGPLGAWLPEHLWNEPLDYEGYSAFSAMIGHGGVVAFDDTANMAALAEQAMAFCALESCGKCTPCRIGSVRGRELIADLRKQVQNHSGDEQTGTAPANASLHAEKISLLRNVCDTMTAGSLCAMGGMTPYPVLSALDHFPQDFGLPATDPHPGDLHA